MAPEDVKVIPPIFPSPEMLLRNERIHYHGDGDRYHGEPQ
jgi:hypothetical protein